MYKKKNAKTSVYIKILKKSKLPYLLSKAIIKPAFYFKFWEKPKILQTRIIIFSNKTECVNYVFYKHLTPQ